MKIIREITKKEQNNRRKFCVRGAAVLLSVMLVLPAIPISVYAEENMYEVQAGDCLWEIAERFLGDGARYADIVAWNKELIQDPNLIYPGMTLHITASAEAEKQADAESATKDVVDGETLKQTSDEVASGSYEKGSINGMIWENEWLGMRLELPEGFRFGDLKDYNIFNNEDDSTFEFMAVNPSYPGMSMIMAVTQLDISMDEVSDEILELLEKELSVFGVKGTNWKSETVKLGGLSFEHYFTEAEYTGVPIYTEYYMAQKEDAVVYLQLFYMDYRDGKGHVHDDMEALINGFS